MKKILYLFVIISVFATIGCAPNKKVIPPLQYQNDINIHIPKIAHIYWIPGKQAGHELSNSSAYSAPNNNGLAGVIGTLVVASIQNQHRKNNPSQYIYEYGKADQVVFITSLKDILEQKNIFKSIDLVTSLDKINTKDVTIKIYFKTTRVTFINDYTVNLSVNLAIQSGNRQYERTYFVQNEEPAKSNDFLAKKTEVSQKLLTLIINGIQQWYEENKS
jgi:hypothetical protein